MTEKNSRDWSEEIARAQREVRKNTARIEAGETFPAVGKWVPARTSAAASLRRRAKRELEDPERDPGDGKDHTPSGWQPAHLRPENQGRDWRDERRSFNQPR